MENDKKHAVDYLLRRGIDQQYVHYLDKSGLFAFEMYEDVPWLVFPMFDDTGFISALNKVDIETGEKRTIGSWPNKYWIDTKFKFRGRVIMVEAVINAMTMNSFSFRTMALVTASNELEPEMFSKCDIVLMLDNDVAGRMAARKLSRLYKDKAKSVKSVFWEGEMAKGFDPNDVLRSYGNAEQVLKEMLENIETVSEWNDHVNFRRLIDAKRRN